MEVSNKTPKRKPTKLEDMTKEQIRQAILKKKECTAKAQGIVESLLEKGISESYLLQCLPDINQSHFDDIVEERSIIYLCGFPLCEHALTEKDIPKQKYRISVKTNKVYDITARKNFCSNTCYKAAIYVKNQMLTSPLWFRQYEDIPKFHLIPQDDRGSMGQEVDVSIINRVKVKSEPIFTSINDFANASIKDICPEEEDKQSDITKDVDTSQNDKIITGNVQNVEINKIKCKEKLEEKISPSKVTEEIKKTALNPMNIVGDIIERPEKRIDPILLEEPKSKEVKPKRILQKKQPVVTVLAIEVEKCLAEWFTLDTMLFLFGEEKVREMVTDKGECIKEYLNNYANSLFYNANSYDQYQQLCKKLNMLELEDRRYDSQTLQRETKPLPDYTIIQEESKKMQLKVKAFFAGQTEIPDPVIEDKSVPEEGSNVTQLPLVDKNAQNALRRRIVCQHLSKVLPDLLRSLGLPSQTISSDVRLLVNTFKLKPNNIMFKPIQWTLIAIVFIKLLSIRDKRLEHLLEQPMAFDHMQLLLLSYKQDGGYLDRLISWLSDIDRLLDTNDTQLTVE